MLTEILILTLTAVVGYILYLYKKVHYNFDSKGVKYLPGWPLFGNTLKSTLSWGHVIDDIDAVYKAFPDERYVGFVELTTPVLLIRDPELIKQITVKDFDHFANHEKFFGEDLDPLFRDSLLMMKGDRWREMRATLSPAFTRSKMMLMIPFMEEISNNIVKHLKDNLDKDIEVDDLMQRYTTDVIASCVFGIKVNSLKDRDNEFFNMGLTLFDGTFFQKVVFNICSMFPKLSTILRLELFSEKTQKFFKDIVITTMEEREKNKIVRPDMIQLLMEAVTGTLDGTGSTEKGKGFASVQEAIKHNTKGWTLNELVSQVFIFFSNGFDNISSILTLLLHELAVNPEVQEKLYQEIKAFGEIKNLTYENIGEMKYLDCVLNESLRKWSSAMIMDREVTKPYELPPPHEGGKPYKLKVGDSVHNIVTSTHMDPKYHPEPKVFNPERFSEENKHKIKPFTFMPFGMGPRACIGYRFSNLAVKMLVYSIVVNYKIMKCKKTMDPIELAPSDLNMMVKDGTWVKLETRK